MKQQKFFKTMGVFINSIDFGASIFVKLATVYLIIMNTTMTTLLMVSTFQGSQDIILLANFLMGVAKVYAVAFILNITFQIMKNALGAKKLKEAMEEED